MKIIRIERVQPKEDPNKAPVWMIGFTDLTTILLAFFILLFATAQPKQGTWDKASTSIRASFGGNNKASELHGEPGDDAKATWTSENNDPGLALDYLLSVVKKYIASEPALSSVSLSKQGETVVLSFDNELGFVSGKADVSPEGQALLDKLAPLLISLPNRLEVMGHADNSAITDDTAYNSNWQLSLDRAVNVRNALANAGYDHKIEMRGRGSIDHLSAEHNNALNNARARRVDLRLYMVHP